MKTTVDVVSARVYEQELRPWLPDKIIDCHVHLGLPEFWSSISAERIAANWALEVDHTQSWEQLDQNCRNLFPDQDVSCVVMGNVRREVDTEANNRYVLHGCLDPACESRALIVTRPDWPASVVNKAMDDGYIGIKPYPDGDSIGNEMSIYDCVSRDQLSVLNRRGGILLLHLPRAGRIGDKDNIRELLEISDDYPLIKLIVAHIGRAYCLPTAKKGLPYLADRDGIYFDTAANLNADVFAYALDTVGPDRVLFGSDLPITMMRGMREHVGENYINYTDGDYSWNKKRKSPDEEANYTYYLYEELRALIRAVERTGLGRRTMDKVMYENTSNLLKSFSDREQDRGDAYLVGDLRL